MELKTYIFQCLLKHCFFDVTLWCPSFGVSTVTGTCSHSTASLRKLSKLGEKVCKFRYIYTVILRTANGKF